MRSLTEENAKRKKNRRQIFYERRSSVMSDSNVMFEGDRQSSKQSSRQPSPEPKKNATDAVTAAANPTFAFQPTAFQQSFKISQSPDPISQSAYTTTVSLVYIFESGSIIIPVPSPSDYAKEIGNLEKLYKNDMKYEKNDDHFVHKLSIFHHLCFKADVLHEIKSKAFSSMFRNHVLNYYLTNINMLENASLDQTCTFIFIHFENPDYRKNNFTK